MNTARLKGRWIHRANHCTMAIAVGASLLVHSPVLGAPPKDNPPMHVPGRLLVKFKQNVAPNSTAEQAALSSAGASVISRINEIGLTIVRTPLNASETAVMNTLKSRGEVEFAELDELHKYSSLPNDPHFPYQWHLNKIGGPGAWETSTGSSSIVIAIIDTGCDPTHPDLQGRYVSGWNFYNNNSNSADVHGHGTSVAGTAAAAGNNATGVASVSWNCRIMPIRVTDSQGYASSSALANALTWAANNGARVANLSFAVTGNSSVKTAAQYFQNAGGVVTVASGNSGAMVTLSDNPYVLTVSATDENDAVASWSNIGNCIDLSAPGVNIRTTAIGGQYGNGSGTSFSAPVVAGVAALVLSVNPSLTGSQVQTILKQSADDLGGAGWDTQHGYGRVNASKAITLAMNGTPPAPPPPSDPPPPPPSADTTKPTVTITSPASGAAVSGQVMIKTTATDNVGVTKVQFYIDGALKSTDTSAPFEWKWNTKPASKGNHTITVKAYDAAGNDASASITVTKF